MANGGARVRVAVIPARGGSKRIPRKNIRPFLGVPIIAWSIAAARQSGCFDSIIVSTDDQQIAEVAVAHGAEVPFMRPAELSTDHATTIPVIAHAVAEMAARGVHASEACCIYATAPFVAAEDLRRGLELLTSSEADYAFTVGRFSYPIERALRLDADGRPRLASPEHENTRSQDLEPAYHDAAQFYWGTADAWLVQRPIFSPRSVAVPLPSHRVQDIDTPEDWVRAEAMMRANGVTFPGAESH